MFLQNSLYGKISLNNSPFLLFSSLKCTYDINYPNLNMTSMFNHVLMRILSKRKYSYKRIGRRTMVELDLDSFCCGYTLFYVSMHACGCCHNITVCENILQSNTQDCISE